MEEEGMEVIDYILTVFAHFIMKYAVYYFSITGLFLVIMLWILVRNKYHQRITIKKIKKLLTKKPDKALKRIIESDMEVIEYFQKQGNVDSNDYIKIKEYLSQLEQVRVIYDKVIYAKENNFEERDIKIGISILAGLATPQATDYLMTFLYDDNQEIVKIVLAELSTTPTDKVIYSLIDYINYIEDSGMLSYLKDIFKKMGISAVKNITPFIHKIDPIKKIFFIDIIGEHVNQEVYQVLSRLLTDDNPEVKINVLQKLEKYELDDEVIDKIIGLLEDKHWGVRCQSVKFLGDLEVVKAAPYLARRLTDESGIVRATATEALINLGYEGIKYVFELVKRPEAPNEVKEILKKQDIAFLIEALENVYENDEQEKRAVNRELSS